MTHAKAIAGWSQPPDSAARDGVGDHMGVVRVGRHHAGIGESHQEVGRNHRHQNACVEEGGSNTSKSTNRILR